MTDRECQIRKLLRNHRCLIHYEASKANAGKRSPNRYAVFVDSRQVTKPKTHAEAQRDREDLLVAAIVKLFEEA